MLYYKLEHQELARSERRSTQQGCGTIANITIDVEVEAAKQVNTAILTLVFHSHLRPVADRAFGKAELTAQTLAATKWAEAPSVIIIFLRRT